MPDTALDTSSSTNGDIPEVTQAFIGDIQEQLALGYGFVPFIGAGFSAPSGAPLTFELEDYLQRCICVALGIDTDTQGDTNASGFDRDRARASAPSTSSAHCLTAISTPLEPWTPRSHRWPPFIDRRRAAPSGYWVQAALNKVNELRQASRLPYVADEYEKVLNEGYGAMHDWRTALLFLSRLIREPRDQNGRHVIWLGPPSQEVIDACFQEVLRGKHPTLGHRMLAVLAGAMRLDLILTTNFDNLLERAFDTARNPLTLSEVQLDDSLPHWSALREGRTLIKLHGGRSAIRADYSLDQVPSEEDKHRFLEYLLSATARHRNLLSGARPWPPVPLRRSSTLDASDPSAAHPEADDIDFQNHLLVMGVAGQERRVRALIEHAVQRLPDDFRVFWICYSDKDAQALTDFNAALTEIRRSQSARRGGKGATSSLGGVAPPIRILRHPELGLFLLQLYQTIRRSLPPLGAIFPSVSRQTLPPLESARWTDGLSAQQPQLKDLVDRLIAEIDALQTTNHPIFVCAHAPSTMGVTSACGRAFRLLETRADVACLWIDMNDISSADNLYEVILEALHYRLGLEDWIPSTSGAHDVLVKQQDPRSKEIDRLVTSVNRKWVLFINAREAPGANTEPGRVNAHGWLDRPSAPSDADDPSACNGAFISLLKALRVSPKLRVVLMGRHEGLLHHGVNTERIPYAPIRLDDTDGVTRTFDVVEVVADAVRWAGEDERRLHFLHGLALMQRPRMLASVWSSALTRDADRCRGRDVTRDEALEWIKRLEQEGLVRRKPGGFVWVHANCRQLLRDAFAPSESLQRPLAQNRLMDDLGRLRQAADIAAILDGYNPDLHSRVIHRELATWYLHLLDASDSPAAAFEAAYHYCRAAGAFLSSAARMTGDARDAAIVDGVGCLDAATSLLRANSYLIQTHGYSRGSCRRLEFTADIASGIGEAWLQHGHGSTDDDRRIRDSVHGFWLASAEVMRAVAREVGEDRKAFVRQRQVGRLICGDSWRDARRACKTGNDGEHDHGEHLSLRVADSLLRRDIAKHPDRYREVLAEGQARIGNGDALAPKSVKALTQPADKRRCVPLSDLLRWWRWSGTLALNTRSYELSECFLRKILGTLGEPQDADRWCLRSQGQRIEVLRAIEQAAHLCLVRASLQSQLNTPKDRNFFERAEGLIRRGLQLSAKIRNSDRSGDSHEMIHANWCETRLLMHHSIVTANSPAADSHVRALGVLGDAEAILRVSDWRRTRSELALLDLHRAEIKRMEADAARRTSDAKHLRSAAALVADSIRFLERAEPVLRQRRRNVYWTTWFFQRKLRAIEMSVRLSKTDAPIPYLGLEAAMRLTDTEADLLLDDAIRMIRVDSYRLATILDAYGDCYLALASRASDGSRMPLPLRLGSMRGNLARGHAALVEVHTGRTAGANGYPKSSELDDDVKTFVDRTLRRAESILNTSSPS